MDTAQSPCQRCGHQNSVEANFCSSCGATLSDRLDAPTELMELVDIEAVAEGSVAGFVVRRGPKAGSRYQLEAGMTSIGRHPESEIFLDDVTVSRRHAEVEEADGHHIVRDAGSLNGTYVNRDRIDECILQPGDEVQIGKFKLVFFVEASA